MGLGRFIAPTQDAATGGSGWTPHSDWIDISEVNDNEINLLVGDFGIPTIAFAVTTSSGTYSIDWGDGTVETSRASGTTYQHSYTVGTGTACSFGYTTFKIRIYGATGNIRSFGIKRHNVSTEAQYVPLLWAVFGTTALTTLEGAFYYFTTPYAYCYALQCVMLPASLNSLTTMSSMCGNCLSLLYIGMPTSMTNLQTLQSAFSACYILSSLVLPATLDNLTTMSSMCSNNASLQSITFPTSSTALTTISSALEYCYSLVTINNLTNLGSTSSVVTGMTFLNRTEMVAAAISMAAKFAKIGFTGASGKLLKVSSIRLTNTGSTFTGSSPQIDIQYTSLANDALEALFDDIPNGLSSKTIKITGATGAVALITKTGLNTSASTLVWCNNTSSLAVGMEVTGADISYTATTYALTFEGTPNTVTKNGHGLPNGAKISFLTIVTTTGISINTPYYVVNTAANTFQVALTAGGDPIELTNDGSGTMTRIPVIVSIDPNVSFTMDMPAFGANGGTASFSVLKRSKALLKGLTITY